MSWKCPFCDCAQPGTVGSVCVNCGENLDGKHDEEIETSAEPTQEQAQPHAETETTNTLPPRVTGVDDDSVCQECGASIPEEGAVCGSCHEPPEAQRIVIETLKSTFVFEPPPPLPSGKKSIIIHSD